MTCTCDGKEDLETFAIDVPSLGEPRDLPNKSPDRVKSGTDRRFFKQLTGQLVPIIQISYTK